MLAQPSPFAAAADPRLAFAASLTPAGIDLVEPLALGWCVCFFFSLSGLGFFSGESAGVA